MNINELLEKIKDKPADEQAKMISNFVTVKKRKATIEDMRKEVRSKVFKNCKDKLTKQQQEAYIYEVLGKNADVVNGWLQTLYPNMFDNGKKIVSGDGGEKSAKVVNGKYVPLNKT